MQQYLWRMVVRSPVEQEGGPLALAPLSVQLNRETEHVCGGYDEGRRAALRSGAAECVSVSLSLCPHSADPQRGPLRYFRGDRERESAIAVPGAVFGVAHSFDIALRRPAARAGEAQEGGASSASGAAPTDAARRRSEPRREPSLGGAIEVDRRGLRGGQQRQEGGWTSSQSRRGHRAWGEQVAGAHYDTSGFRRNLIHPSRCELAKRMSHRVEAILRRRRRRSAVLAMPRGYDRGSQVPRLLRWVLCRP